jgi:uncharacterized protein
LIPLELIRDILAQYSLPRRGVHGPAHWARVLENGLRLAGITGADPVVVRLFAVLHDCRRRSEGVDPRHGPRAAHYARRLRSVHLDLDRARFELLCEACAGHTDGKTDADVTIQTCWDADRLDLGRVGIRVDPRLLCTAAARDAGMIAWATRRALENHRPDFMSGWR